MKKILQQVKSIYNLKSIPLSGGLIESLNIRGCPKVTWYNEEELQENVGAPLKI